MLALSSETRGCLQRGKGKNFNGEKKNKSAGLFDWNISDFATFGLNFTSVWIPRGTPMIIFDIIIVIIIIIFQRRFEWINCCRENYQIGDVLTRIIRSFSEYISGVA